MRLEDARVSRGDSPNLSAVCEMRILCGKFALAVGCMVDERIHGIIWA